MESSNETWTTISSKYWGTARISQRECSFEYTKSTRPEQKHVPPGVSVTVKNCVEVPVTQTFNYHVPKSQGEGVIIYMIETEVSFKADYLDIEKTRYKRLSAAKYGSDPFFKGAETRDDPANMHGTIVANVAASTTFGAAPKATVVAVYRGTGSGEFRKALNEIITDYEAMQAPRPPAIINASFGQMEKSASQMMIPKFYALEEFLGCNDLIEKLVNEYKILIVAAAGNQHQVVSKEDRDLVAEYIDTEKKNAQRDLTEILNKLDQSKLLLPAGHPLVLSVGAHDEQDNCTKFYHGTGVDIYAPGCYVPYFLVRDGSGQLVDTCTPNTKGTAQLQGSSFAAPLIAGSIACRIAQREQEKQPRMDPGDWIKLIKKEARHKTCLSTFKEPNVNYECLLYCADPQ